MTKSRMAWFKGHLVPETEARVSFRDFGFQVGDGVFDTARTVGHRPFLFEEHVARLYRSLGYVGIDPGLTFERMLAITLEVLEANLPLLGPDDDYWVTQWISRGERAEDRLGVDGPPTIVVECSPLPFRNRAKGMRDGLDVVTPAGIRRTPPEAMSPRVKSMSYANLLAGDQEVQRMRPGATSVLLDTRGCLAEGLGSNIFIVRGGEVLTPFERYVLGGLSREIVIGIARKLAVPLRETDIDLYDAYAAEEAFVTSTSWCMVPVRSVNGKPVGNGRVPGPVTARLVEGYKERLGGFDFVAQYTKRLEGAN